MEKQPGKKHRDELKEKAFALLVSNNAAFVAKELGLPYTTVKTWENKFIKEGKKKPDGTTSLNDEDNLVKLRNKKREEFVESAWKNITLANTILNRKLVRALEKEVELDVVLEEALKETVGSDRRKTLVSNIASMKLDDINKLSTTLGTLYDKQALANGEATSREEQIVKKFEDY